MIRQNGFPHASQIAAPMASAVEKGLSEGIDDPAASPIGPAPIHERLARLVQKITRDDALRQDLMQEALVHLWLSETRRPGQTDSWYLQSCKFHLQHYLAAGRSVDSVKRRDGGLQFAVDAEDSAGIPEEADSGNSVLTSVSARELISLLSSHLQAREKAVLHCLADGLGAREIGRELNISHTMVIRYRRRIAALLTKLESSSNGRTPLPARPSHSFPSCKAETRTALNGSRHSYSPTGVGREHQARERASVSRPVRQ